MEYPRPGPQQAEYFLDFIKGGGGRHHLRLMDLLKLSLRVFRVRPMRTFLTIFGASIGIGTVLFLVSLGYGLQFILIGQLATTEDSLISLEAFYPVESGKVITQDDINMMAGTEGADEVSPVAEFPGEASVDSLSGFLTAKIVRQNYFRLSGTKTAYGSIFTEGEEAVVVSNTTLKLFGLPEDETIIGQSISLNIFYPSDDPLDIKTISISNSVIIKGIVVDEFAPPFIYIPSDIIGEKPPYYQRVFVKAQSIELVEPLKDRLIETGLLISARLDLVKQASRIMTAVTIVLGVFGVTALIVSSIGMFNTMIIGFLERIFEVGIMKSIGATARDIRNLFLMESLIMGLLGGVGGIIIGVGGGELVNFGLNALARQLGGSPIDIFIYPVRFIIAIALTSAIVGIMSGFWPARRASKLPPRQAFKRQ